MTHDHAIYINLVYCSNGMELPCLARRGIAPAELQAAGSHLHVVLEAQALKSGLSVDACIGGGAGAILVAIDGVKHVRERDGVDQGLDIRVASLPTDRNPLHGERASCTCTASASGRLHKHERADWLLSAHSQTRRCTTLALLMAYIT